MLTYGEQLGWAAGALEAGEGTVVAPIWAKLLHWPIALPHPLAPCPTGRPAVGWGQEVQGGVPSPGPEQDPEPAVAVPRSQRGAAPPTPLGPSVIRAIFRPLFLPISGLWTGPESGLSWGRGLEPLNWALARELQPQRRPQRGRSPGGGGEPGRGQARGRAGWGRILAHLTPPLSPHWPIPLS